MVKLICAECGEVFVTEPWQVRRGRKYCSKRCGGLARRGIPLSEEACANIRAANPHRSGWNHTEEAKKKISVAHYRGDNVKGQAGRRRARVQYPIAKPCEICGAKPENTRINRHHIDEDPLNNSMNNIQFLCNPCHYQVHKELKRRKTCLSSA